MAMLIAHLPAAYLVFRTVAPSLPRPVLVAGLIGSVAPDLDMFWFVLIDGSVHHHAFLTHRPVFWGMVLLMGLLVGRGTLRPRIVALAAGG